MEILKLVFSLSRTVFQHIIKTSGKEELDKRLKYLSTVDQVMPPRRHLRRDS